MTRRSPSADALSRDRAENAGPISLSNLQVAVNERTVPAVRLATPSKEVAPCYEDRHTQRSASPPPQTAVLGIAPVTVRPVEDRATNTAEELQAMRMQRATPADPGHSHLLPDKRRRSAAARHQHQCGRIQHDRYLNHQPFRKGQPPR